MQRLLFESEHDAFRLMVRDFIEREVAPNFEEWERDGILPRHLFQQLGALGITGATLPEDFGGSGVHDYRYNVILQEEAARAHVKLGTFRTQLDVVLPYFLSYCDEEQRRRWFPGLAAGELLTAIAMSEPATGSDLAGMQTTAVRHGESYLLNGSKTFITGGSLADLVIVVARTATEESNRRAGLSLLVVESGMPGFHKGRRLEKLGLRAEDTVELAFNDVEVPVRNRLGQEGQGFEYLARNLAQERLAIAVGSVAQTRAALDATVAYVRQRPLFGQPLSQFQNTKFELAAVATELEAAQALLDRAIATHVRGVLSAVDAAKTKLFCTEVQGRSVDRCLQLFGGYGYIHDFPMARLYADARVARIYGGASEVMKVIISKSLGL